MTVAAYIRVSTEEQTQGYSLGEQERSIRAFCVAQDLDEPELFADAITGRRDDRPELVRALEAGPEVLVVAKLDRLGRGARRLLELFDRFDSAGIRFVAISDGIDTATGAGKTYRNLLAVMAEMESDRISERVRAVTRARAQAGRPHGGPRPYGYVYGEGLEVEPAEAEIVRRIFAEHLAGRSITAIARELERDGVRTMRGGPWRTSTVGGVLRNPVYAGLVKHGGETFAGQHEPIIDPEQWEQAQRLLEARPSRGRGRRPKGAHLFRGGFLRCGECGEAMVPRTNGAYELYYCNGRAKLGTEHCSMRTSRRAAIDTAVYRYFEQVGLDVEATREQLSAQRDRRLAEVRALRSQAEAEAQKATERLARVRRDYSDGRLDASDWQSFRDELGAERDAAEAEVERLSASETDLEQWAALRDAESDVLRQLAGIRSAIAGEVTAAADVDAVRSALMGTFERFEVRHQAPRVHAELAWQGTERELVIVPVPHEDAVEGYSETASPVLRRRPLAACGSNDASASPAVESDITIFEPIPVGDPA